VSADSAAGVGPFAAREFARILLIKPSSLGDIVHALPVLHGLRRRYPNARIDWLVADSCAGLIRGHPDLTGVVGFDRKRYGRISRSLPVAGEFARFLNSLRGVGYDLVIDLQGLFRSGFIAFATGAFVRMGFADARELAGLFYTHRIPIARDKVHAAQRNYGVASLLGFAHLPMTFDLALTDPERAIARDILAAAGISDFEPFIAVLPGARWETKRWLPERFVEVIDRLAAQDLGRCVLMGAPDEQPLCTEIAARCRCSTVNLAGRTGLRDVAAILHRAAVVLCQDSAPMHLAAAQDRPLVALLGPTSPARTGPFGGQSTVLQARLPCVPCYFRRLSQCPHEHECMRSLTVDEVAAAVARTLQSLPT
jgi:lipopolysaccharide heptosyltransferase I